MHNGMVLFMGSIKRNKAAILIGLFLGMVFCLTQANIGTTINSGYDKMTVAYVDNDHSIMSEGLGDYLSEEIGIEVFDAKTYEEYKDALLNRDISAIIEVPEALWVNAAASGNIGTVSVTTINSYANEAYLKSYIDSYLGSAGILVKASEGDETLLSEMLGKMNMSESGVTTVAPDESVIIKSDNIRGFQFVMGFYLVFMFFIGINVGFLVMTDRVNGVFRRIKGTLIRPVQYIAGITGYAFITGMLVNMIYLGYLEINGIDVGVPLWLNLYLMTMFVIIVIGVALSVAMIVRTKLAVIISIYVIGCLAALLGGAFFDTSKAPDNLERISKLMPQYWVINCIRDCQTNVDFNYIPNVIIVGLFALLMVLISIVLYRRQCVSED